MDNKFKSAIAFGGFIIFVIIVGTFSSLNGEVESEKIEINQNYIENIPPNNEDEKICVHIIGAVKKPGIIEAPKDSRIYQIVELAGGFLENANETAINLAQTVNDEEKIIIPYNETSLENEEKINQMYKSTQINTFDKVNINTASIEELKTLTGIGQSTAEKIINYRNEISKFEKIEDIKNVSGIGDSKFNSIKEKIVVK